ncbi:hypothetical protein BDY21DRAFT_198627 [Lineolata rhizophorae]|uniref:Secreted protein n=1 Tax=Lineolata rhizophorae TaxID=578093 RepID=A0A6A6P535_9PEZI|nr:hypothetical protein BDY21DRAFT_198627 [Lineolata rhizophorae]
MKSRWSVHSHLCGCTTPSGALPLPLAHLLLTWTSFCASGRAFLPHCPEPPLVVHASPNPSSSAGIITARHDSRQAVKMVDQNSHCSYRHIYIV